MPLTSRFRCSCIVPRPEDLKKSRIWGHLPFGVLLSLPCCSYIVPRPEDLRKARVERRKGEALKVTQRPIQHPLYKNISMADAAAALTAANVAVRGRARADWLWVCGVAACPGPRPLPCQQLRMGQQAWPAAVCTCQYQDAMLFGPHRSCSLHLARHSLCPELLLPCPPARSSCQPGECIIRPSHTGPMKLCLTIRMPEGVWHLDLLEQGKVRPRVWRVQRDARRRCDSAGC